MSLTLQAASVSDSALRALGEECPGLMLPGSLGRGASPCHPALVLKGPDGKSTEKEVRRPGS